MRVSHHSTLSTKRRWPFQNIMPCCKLRHVLTGWVLLLVVCWTFNIGAYPQDAHLRDLLAKQPTHNNYRDCTDATTVPFSTSTRSFRKNAASNTVENVYKFTVAICLVVSDGEAYFQEWVDYHLMAMNFENIYVYDNSKSFDLARWYNHTRQHPVYSRVEVHHRPGKGTDDGKGRYLQAGVYEDCIQQYGKSEEGPQHDYFALIDIDEFLVPQTPQYTNIHGILEDYLVPYGGALVSNWMLFGSANRTVYSPVPVTKRFQYRDAEPNHVVKSIVKATDFQGNRNPHAVKLADPTNVHTTEYPGAIQPNVYNESDKTKASSFVKASGVLLVHHYRYTSDKEHFYKRCIRDGLIGRWCDKKKGTIKSADKTPSHIQLRPGEVFDDQAWKLLTSKVPKYRIFDTPEWEDFM